ncbi:hypothetical protein BCV71DRAFT_191417, partial [Rhizopus microsporus]
RELLAGLNVTLSNYGAIRDINVVKDNATGTFLNSGFAISMYQSNHLLKIRPPLLELSRDYLG